MAANAAATPLPPPAPGASAATRLGGVGGAGGGRRRRTVAPSVRLLSFADGRAGGIVLLTSSGLLAVLMMAIMQGSVISTIRGGRGRGGGGFPGSRRDYDGSGEGRPSPSSRESLDRALEGLRRTGGSVCGALPPQLRAEIGGGEGRGGASSSSSSSYSAASDLWTSNVALMLSASLPARRSDADDGEEEEGWTRSLLASLSPSSLRRSAAASSEGEGEGGSSTLRADPDAVRGLLRRVRDRIVDPTSHPPVLIVVYGGSNAEGQGCVVPAVAVPTDAAGTADDAPDDGRAAVDPLTPVRRCVAWPQRFGSLINNLLGAEVVNVVNLAEGGTDPSLALTLVRNGMYPPSVLLPPPSEYDGDGGGAGRGKERGPRGPDVVIDAYSYVDYGAARGGGGGGGDAGGNTASGGGGSIREGRRRGSGAAVVVALRTAAVRRRGRSRSSSSRPPSSPRRSHGRLREAVVLEDRRGEGRDPVRGIRQAGGEGGGQVRGGGGRDRGGRRRQRGGLLRRRRGETGVKRRPPSARRRGTPRSPGSLPITFWT